MSKVIQVDWFPVETLGYNQKRMAAVLGICARKLREETKAGRIHCNHLGIYPRSEGERWLKQTLIRKSA